MTEVEISIVGAKATAKKKGTLTCGMVGVPVSFIFDQSWEGLNIIPVFRCGGIIKDNGIKNNRTTIPYEVLQYAGNELYIGAEGRSTDGKLSGRSYEMGQAEICCHESEKAGKLELE